MPKDIEACDNPKSMSVVHGLAKGEERVSLVKAMLREIKTQIASGWLIPKYDLSWFDRHGTRDASFAAVHPLLDVPTEIVVDLLERDNPIVIKDHGELKIHTHLALQSSGL